MKVSGIIWTAIVALGQLAISVKGVIVVAADGSGNYRNLQSAIDSISAPNTTPVQIHIKPGRYNGHVSIPYGKSSINFLGQGAFPTNTLVTWSVSSAGGSMEHSTLSIYATNLLFENLAIQNTWPVDRGQANAITSSCRAAFNQFKNVWILSTQDTIYLQGGPHYFTNCCIAGTVDFICGDGPAWFDNCELAFVERSDKGGGILTANNCQQFQKFGFVFKNCTITGANTHQANWLGRPWSPFASVTFLHCKMDASIHPQGWCPWKAHTPGTEARFNESGSMDLNGSPLDLSGRVGPSQNWNRTKVALSVSMASAFTRDNVLMGWVPPNWPK